MNIQDLISTIINYVKNMDKKDLVIFSLIFYLVIKTRNIEGNENVTAIDDSTLNSSHLAAIRNLGNFAKELQSGNDITIPGNVKIDGNLDLQKGDKKFRIALDSGDSVMMQTNQSNVQFGPYLGDTDSDISAGSWTNDQGPIVRGYNLIFQNNIESDSGNMKANYIKSTGGIYSGNGKIHLTSTTDGTPYFEAKGNNIVASNEIEAINFKGNGFFINNSLIFQGKHFSNIGLGSNLDNNKHYMLYYKP